MKGRCKNREKFEVKLQTERQKITPMLPKFSVKKLAHLMKLLISLKFKKALIFEA